MTKVKMNMKGLYDTHECRKCSIENETQEHIYKCEEILKLKAQKYEKYPEYEKIISGNSREKLQIARIFRENMKIIESIPL